jgi:hypothetical protein
MPGQKEQPSNQEEYEETAQGRQSTKQATMHAIRGNKQGDGQAEGERTNMLNWGLATEGVCAGGFMLRKQITIKVKGVVVKDDAVLELRVRCCTCNAQAHVPKDEATIVFHEYFNAGG